MNWRHCRRRGHRATADLRRAAYHRLARGEDDTCTLGFANNPTGVDALQWHELPTPEPRPSEVRVAIQAASLNFPDLLIVQNKYQFKPAAAVRAGLGVRRRDRSGGRGRQAPEGRRRGGRDRRHRRLRHPRHRRCQPRACRCRPASRSSDGAAFAFTYGTSHHALIDRGRAQGRRDGARARRRRRRRHRGAADRQGRRRARDRRRVERRQSARCACRSAPTRPSTTASENLREALKAAHRRQGPRRDLRPGGRRPRRAGVPLDRLARPLPGGRLRAGGIPALPFNLALLKGASVVGVFWGDFVRREPAASAQGMAAAGAVVRAGQDQAGDRPAAADGAPARGLCAHGPRARRSARS